LFTIPEKWNAASSENMAYLRNLLPLSSFSSMLTAAFLCAAFLMTVWTHVDWKGSRSIADRSTTQGLKEKVSFVRWSRWNQSVTSTQPTHSSISVKTLENENV